MREPLKKLSPREWQAYNLMLLGMSVKEIAREMGGQTTHRRDIPAWSLPQVWGKLHGAADHSA